MSAFWKPDSSSTFLREESSRDSENASRTFNFSNAPLAQQRMLLPIYKHKRQILYSVEHYGVLIIVGETGTGKSTQVLQYLFENGWCENDFQVACTQPRRIAAQTLAQRVSQEVGKGPVGATVGYSVRFDDRTSAASKIKFLTDGILLREATLHDPLLSRYSVIMVDEAHERNINSDAILGLLKKIRRKRKELRIIICSATIDAEAFLDFFVGKNIAAKKRKRRWDNPNTQREKQNSMVEKGTIISVDGRQYSVDILYLISPTTNYVRSTIETALMILRESKAGDILCFLPSAEDIDEAIKMGEDFMDNKDPSMHKKITFLPLYSSLPYNIQARVFQPPNDRSGSYMRRVILATNIAETSVTVPRITHVIDSGLVKLPYFDPKTDFDRLVVVPTSKASAQQRSGRAGRIQAGQCYRLYTEDYFLKQMERNTPPEMLRTNLTSFVLTLKALGVENILAFDLMDLPGVDTLSHGLESLFALGAIDEETNLTKLGLDMSSFPTEPRVSRMLLESLKEGCAREVAGVASTLQVRSLFIQPRGPASRRQQLQLDYDAAISEVADSSGDHATYVNVIAEYDDHAFDREDCKERFLNFVALKRVIEIRNQLLRFLKKFGRVSSLGMAEREERSSVIRKCVTAGFFFNVAKMNNDGKYYTIRGSRKILVTPSHSSIFHSKGFYSEYIIFCETHDGSRGGIELSGVSAIDARWLRELAPHYWE
jgi:ATP-dependent RNA helicase DDX35